MTQSTVTRVKSDDWTPSQPAGERNYPMNCWWVAALSDELGQDLQGRWLRRETA